MSRLWRYGTVYSRVRDFIVGKHHSWESRPIWFDVWTKHPPLRDPVLLERVPVNDIGLRERWDPEAVNDLIYEADYIRSKYRNTYIDSPVSCLNTLPLEMPLSEKILRKMNKKKPNYDINNCDELYQNTLKDLGVNQSKSEIEEMVSKFSKVKYSEVTDIESFGEFETEKKKIQPKVAPVPSVSSLLEELLKNKMKLLEEKKNMEKAKNPLMFKQFDR